MMERLQIKAWLSGVNEISDYCGCGKTKINKMLSRGELKGARKFGKTWMIRRIDLDAFLRYGRPFRGLNKSQKEDIREGGKS